MIKNNKNGDQQQQVRTPLQFVYHVTHYNLILCFQQHMTQRQQEQ